MCDRKRIHSWTFFVSSPIFQKYHHRATKFCDCKSSVLAQNSDRKGEVQLCMVLLFLVMCNTVKDKPKIERKFALFSFRDLSLIFLCLLKPTCVLVMIREIFAACTVSRKVKMRVHEPKDDYGNFFVNLFHPRKFETSLWNLVKREDQVGTLNIFS